MDVYLIIARAVHFAACLICLGVSAMDQLVVVPEARPSWRGIARRISAVCLFLAAVSGIAWFLLLARDFGDSTFTWRLANLVWHHTNFGHVWQWRAGFLVAAIAFSFGTRRLFLLANLALTGSLAWAGHGQTGAWTRWHLPMDVIHLLAAGFWMGSLLPFLVLLLRLKNAPQREVAVPSVVKRFSMMALICVMLMIISGVVAAICLLADWSDLWQTPYGQVLLAKIGIFAGMIALAAFNRLCLCPRISEIGRQSLLRKMVTLETALGFAVIGVVAILGLLAPTR